MLVTHCVACVLGQLLGSFWPDQCLGYKEHGMFLVVISNPAAAHDSQVSCPQQCSRLTHGYGGVFHPDPAAL